MKYNSPNIAFLLVVVNPITMLLNESLVFKTSRECNSNFLNCNPDPDIDFIYSSVRRLLLFFTIQYNTIQYNTIQYNVLYFERVET